MCDNLCPECKESEVDPDLDTCHRCFLLAELEEYRYGDRDDPSQD
jgi:hypothetical protein